MKVLNFMLMILCIGLMAGTYGCEKADLQKSTTVEKPISPRVDDCEECPNEDDCCCFVWLEENETEATLRFCGTTDGTGPCSGSTPCDPDPNGGQQTIILDADTNPGQHFCVALAGSFWIYNPNMSDDADVLITCQAGELSPQIIHRTVPADGTIYLDTNGSCELSDCQ
jgi:hypothetical protein